MSHCRTHEPKLLFVFADQMHAFAMGCMGNADIDTPNLDRLAQQGALFRSCYSSNAVCTPYRAALMSGRYPSQTGIVNNAPKPIPATERTIADCLNEHNVRTSYVGKWHIGGGGNVWVPPELRAGFTDFIGYQCYNDFLRDVLFFDEDGECRQYACHRLEATTDLAIERMARIKDRAFAMFVSYQCPHYPVQPSEEYAEKYWTRPVTLRPNFREVEKPFVTAGEAYSREDDPDYLRKGEDTVSYIRMYYALIAQMDAQIGRLLDTLDDWGIAEDTLVVFTSDHGDLQGSHGLKNKHVYFEESTHCPLIVRNPKAPAGNSVVENIDTVDFLPSILDWFDCPRSPLAEGYSFLPLTEGRQWQKPENEAFSENHGNGICPSYLMLVSNRLKVVVNRKTHEPFALFNLETDPYELENLAAKPEWAETVRRLGERAVWRHADMLTRAGHGG